MTTAKQKRQNRTAQRAKERNQKDIARLDTAQKDLDALPAVTPGSPEAARRQQIQDAINAKRNDLNAMNQQLDEYLASEDDDERAQLQDDYNARRDLYRDTSSLTEGVAEDPCAPCTIAKDVWDIVEVKPTTWEKQYVNIDRRCWPMPTPHEQHSRTIRVTAKIQPAKRGKLIYWTLHADPNNRTLHSKQGGNPTAVPPVPHPPLEGSLGATLSRARSRTNAQGIATVTLNMGLYGGDKFQVSASAVSPTGAAGPTAAGAPLRTAIFEVWRKLWYAIIEMENPVGPNWAVPAVATTAAVNAYQKVFVELVDSGEKKTGRHQENFETHGAAHRWADRQTTRKFVPWKVVYSAIEFCVPLSGSNSRQQRPHTEPTVTSMTQTLSGTFDLYDYRIGQRTARRNWFVSAQASQASTGKTATLTTAHFRRLASPPYGPQQLEVKLDGTGIIPSAAQPVVVTLNYWHSPGFNGWGGTNLHLLICHRSMQIGYGAQTEAAMGGTCTHEPGHALGLTHDLPWRNPANQGHCGVRACVMWFQGYITPSMRPYDFHVVNDAGTAVDPNCHTYLRGKVMGRDAMQIWRFPR